MVNRQNIVVKAYDLMIMVYDTMAKTCNTMRWSDFHKRAVPHRIVEFDEQDFRRDLVHVLLPPSLSKWRYSRICSNSSQR